MDPLGKLVISDGDSEISIDTTYLDSWLAALIDGLQQLSATGHVRVDTEEPKPIEIDVVPEGHLLISYKGKQVVAEGLKELELALRAAVSDFLAGIEDCPEASQNRLIDPIRRFWVTTQN